MHASILFNRFNIGSYMQDLQLIRETLTENDFDVDATITYLLQITHTSWDQLQPGKIQFQYSLFNPFRTKTPKYLFPRGNKPLLYHQIGNRNFFIFITNQ